MEETYWRIIRRGDVETKTGRKWSVELIKSGFCWTQSGLLCWSRSLRFWCLGQWAMSKDRKICLRKLSNDNHKQLKSQYINNIGYLPVRKWQRVTNLWWRVSECMVSWDCWSSTSGIQSNKVIIYIFLRNSSTVLGCLF